MPGSKRKDSYGVRYGVKARNIVKEIEAKQRLYYPCPQCGHKKVKRTDSGVWKCKRCGIKFSGGAYFPQTTPGLEAEKALKGVTPED